MVDAGSSYGALIAGLALTGWEPGSSIPSATTAGVTALDPSRASLAGGLIYMCQIAGGAIGLGITTTIFTITSENELDAKANAAGPSLTDHQVAVLHGALAGTDSGQAALQQLPVRPRDRSSPIVGDSFAIGIQAGFRFVTDRRGPRLPDLAVLRRRSAPRPARRGRAGAGLNRA